MGATVRIELDPLGIVLDAEQGSTLESILAMHGVEFPCGGAGTCGGCRVQVLAGAAEPQEADLLVLTDAELAAGYRLACRIRADSPLKLKVDQWSMPVLSDDAAGAASLRHGLAVAIDLGTTTLAAQLIDQKTGAVLGLRTALNPQSAHGADVMSRVRFSLSNGELTTLIRSCLAQMIADLADGRAAEIVEVVLVGNTVMHHLFCGLDAEPLAHVPFRSPNLGEQRFSPQQLGWNLPASAVIRFLPCLGGFVGSDILAGIHAVGMGASENLMALVDLGTNGEIAIGNRHGIVCASTAAGPAFEAGSIRMGMRAATGAIARVSIQEGQMRATVIGDAEPRGICGSGLVDAVAAGLEIGAILSSGRFANGTKIFPVQSPVVLYQSDIRELQLAKAAIASGFRLLIKHLGVAADDVQSLSLAGAFGNYVQIDSAIGVGMLETPKERIHAAGNTALRGAKILLLSNSEPVLPEIEHISLAADSGFQDEYVKCMTFPGVESYV